MNKKNDPMDMTFPNKIEYIYDKQSRRITGYATDARRYILQSKKCIIVGTYGN